jgi:lipopolysaccharide export system permease protein
MKKLIFRKFLKDILIFFIILSFSLSIIVWVIQAVNFLDFVSEDGHGFRVYFSYTLLSFPKVFSRIYLLVFFISVFYIILKYEDKNELIIFWTLGISKVDFIKNLTKFSIFFLLVLFIFTGFVTPKAGESARSFIRDSNIEFFPSLIREKKFIDTVAGLTIYIDEYTKDKKIMKNIFLKDQSPSTEAFQIITAKEGRLINKNGNNYFIFKNGEMLNNEYGDTTSFKFENFQFNISKFTTKSTITPKIQETSTQNLVKCFLNVSYKKNYFIDQRKITRCDQNYISNIKQELLKRFYLPLYIPFIVLIAGLLILKSKEQRKFNSYKILIFIIGFLTIFLSEISIKYTATSAMNNYLFFLIPIIFYFATYFFYFKKTNNYLESTQ